MPDDQQPVTPIPQLPSFGEEMRKEREIRGISLKEIADSTKISKRYLEAIEKDDYNTLPAPVFTRGFVREYARYLGLNPDEAVNRYLHYRQSREEAGQVLADKRREPGRDIAREPLREMRHETARETLRKLQAARDKPETPEAKRVNRGVIAFFVILLLFIGLVWALRNPSLWRGGPRPEPQGTSNETVARVLTREVAPTPTADRRPPIADLVMRVRATENSWIALDADGRSVFNSELREGEEQTFRAKERFVFKTVGNAGGIQITLNDVAVPTLGDSGEVVRNRVFDREFLLKSQKPEE